jgi:hypothetical protein
MSAEEFLSEKDLQRAEATARLAYLVVNALGGPNKGNYRYFQYDDGNIRISTDRGGVNSGIPPSTSVSVQVVKKGLFKKRYEPVLDEYGYKIFRFREGRWIEHLEHLADAARQALAEKAEQSELAEEAQKQAINKKNFSPIDD